MVLMTTPIVINTRDTKSALYWSERTRLRERSDGAHGAPALEQLSCKARWLTRKRSRVRRHRHDAVTYLPMHMDEPLFHNKLVGPRKHTVALRLVARAAHSCRSCTLWSGFYRLRALRIPASLVPTSRLKIPLKTVTETVE